MVVDFEGLGFVDLGHVLLLVQFNSLVVGLLGDLLLCLVVLE